MRDCDWARKREASEEHMVSSDRNNEVVSKRKR